MKHLIDTKPRLCTCNRCGAYVLAGMQSGMRFAVDVTPLNPATYRAMTMAGVMTWHIKGRTFNDHGCGCSALDASAFEELPVPPSQAPALEDEVALAMQGLGASVVTPARPHRSDVVRCAKCDTIIRGDMIMLEWPVWQENTHKVPNRGQRKGYTRTYEGWGHARWAIHPDGCPAPTTS